MKQKIKTFCGKCKYVKFLGVSKCADAYCTNSANVGHSHIHSASENPDSINCWKVNKNNDCPYFEPKKGFLERLLG